MALSAKNEWMLEARGLDVEMLTKIGVSDSGQGGFDIAIPYIQGDQIVNHKYRTLGEDKRFAQDKDAVKCFWNVDALLEPGLRRVIITEGELDAFAAIQAGEVHTLSVPDGAPSVEIADDNTSTKYSYLLDALPLFTNIKEIVLAVDDDVAGHRLLHDLSLRFNPVRCKFVRYPKGCKDLGDVLANHGQAKVVEVLANAEWMGISGVFALSELPPAPEPVPLDTGVPLLEKHFRMREGDLSVITGIPGRGKSTLVNQIVAGMIEKWGWRVGLAAFEQRPTIDGRRNFGTLHIGKLWRNLTDDERMRADTWINENILWIYPPNLDEELTFAWLMDRFATCVVRHGCKLLILDPWNELDHVRPPGMTETEYVGFAIREMKRFAMRHSGHVMVVAHPAKLQRGKDGKLPKVTLYDIAGSANFYNKPDAGIIVDTVGDVTEIEVSKTRVRSEIGIPGKIELVLNQTTGRYDVDPHTLDFDQ